jgi:hypothetical protein
MNQSKVQVIADDIAQQLEETNPSAIEQIKLLIRVIGAERCYHYLDIARRMYEEGGLKTSDGSRARTFGGVFFFVCRGRMNMPEHQKVWPDSKHPHHRNFILRPTWEEIAEAAAEVKNEPGESRTAKLIMVARPGKVIPKGDVVMMTITYEAVPQLLKDFPRFEPTPMIYLVCMTAKQWRKVEQPIRKLDERLVLEGYPRFHPKLKTMYLFATLVSTVSLQQAQRLKNQEAMLAKAAEAKKAEATKEE